MPRVTPWLAAAIAYALAAAPADAATSAEAAASATASTAAPSAAASTKTPASAAAPAAAAQDAAATSDAAAAAPGGASSTRNGTAAAHDAATTSTPTPANTLTINAAPPASPSTAIELPSPLRLADVLAALRARSPELREKRALAAAASATPATVTLEDPTLSLEWWQQPIDFATVPLMLTLRQPLPWPGKLAARREVARRAAVGVGDAAAAAARRLEAEAKRAFLDLALAERSLGISDRERTLLEAMVAVAQAKYRVGRSPQAAVLQTQSLLLTVDNERLDLERGRDQARARLNALLDRPAEAPLPAPALPPPPACLPSEGELVQLALAARPDLRQLRAAIAEADAKLTSARREALPDFALWAGYMVNVRGVDTFTVGVSTTLPVFGAGRARALGDVGRAELAARHAAFDAGARRLEQEVHSALVELETAERHERLHSDKLIPLAELALQSAEAAYQNDRIDFYAVLDAARMLRDHHLNHERYAIEYERKLADLELAIGRDLPRVDTTPMGEAPRGLVKPMAGAGYEDAATKGMVKPIADAGQVAGETDEASRGPVKPMAGAGREDAAAKGMVKPFADARHPRGPVRGLVKPLADAGQTGDLASAVVKPMADGGDKDAAATAMVKPLAAAARVVEASGGAR